MSILGSGDDCNMTADLAQFDLTREIADSGQQKPWPSWSLITLGASINHEVEAIVESVFLLTISWPHTEHLLALQHRGYGLRL